MKKNYLILLGLMFVATFVVAAINVGDIITQQQLDGINFGNIDLGESFIKEDGKATYDCDYRGECTFYIKYKTLKNEIIDGDLTGNYEVVEQTSKIKTNIKTWVDIKNEHNKTYAIQQLRTYLVDRKDLIINVTKQRLARKQTQVQLDMSEFVEDLNL